MYFKINNNSKTYIHIYINPLDFTPTGCSRVGLFITFSALKFV